MESLDKSLAEFEDLLSVVTADVSYIGEVAIEAHMRDGVVYAADVGNKRTRHATNFSGVKPVADTTEANISRGQSVFRSRIRGYLQQDLAFATISLTAIVERGSVVRCVVEDSETIKATSKQAG